MTVQETHSVDLGGGGGRGSRSGPLKGHVRVQAGLVDAGLVAGRTRATGAPRRCRRWLRVSHVGHGAAFAFVPANLSVRRWIFWLLLLLNEPKIGRYKQGSLKREGTTANDVFVLVKSAESHLIPSKYVGKSLPPTLS